MSRLLESVLDDERKADADRNDARHEFGRGPSGAHYADIEVTFPPVPLRSYVWPAVDALRAKPRQERRQGPRSSRFGNLS